MTINLTEASSQWATRPADERYWTPQELYEATRRHREQSRQARVSSHDLRVEPMGAGGIQMVGKTGAPAQFTHWSFGQLSGRAGAPASYLRTLPATLACQNLNHGLKRAENGDVQVLFRQTPDLQAFAITSGRYGRIWNYSIVERLLQLPGSWRTPPARPAVDDPRARPATEADVLSSQGFGLSVKVGDMIAPAGLYASDEDLFVFMVDEVNRIEVGSKSLARGFFASNSEVGKARFKVRFFTYDHVCGNHIVWNASNIREVSIRHVGSEDRINRRAFDQLQMTLTEYSNSSASEAETKIRRAQQFKLGSSVEEVVDFVFGKGFATRKDAQEAYLLAETNRDTDGDPQTAWGMANGLTRLSQLKPYTDARVGVDAQAGRLLEVAF